MNKKLVLFDFDGTITSRDTLFEFLAFYKTPLVFYSGLFVLSPMLILYKLGFIQNSRAKELLMSFFIKGDSVLQLDEAGKRFAEKKMQALVRTGAIRAIEEYRAGDADMVVVSASAENWVKPWCDQHALRCIATRLETRNGKLTGRFDGLNCFGEEKCSRISKEFDLNKYDRIIAYGDSRGDEEMLALAHEKHYKPFRD